MIEQLKWFDRSHNFDFPIELYPCLIERLRGTAGRLEELLRSHPSRFLTVRLNGAWSMQEHAGHLYDLDELHNGRLDDFIAGAATLRGWDVTNKKTVHARYNVNSLDTILRNFRSTRHHFVYRLENIDNALLSRIAQHPRLQLPMRLVDMVYFVAEHDDHHLARISAIARTLQQRS